MHSTAHCSPGVLLRLLAENNRTSPLYPQNKKYNNSSFWWQTLGVGSTETVCNSIFASWYPYMSCVHHTAATAHMFYVWSLHCCLGRRPGTLMCCKPQPQHASCLQVLLSQWMPAKALDQAVAAVKHFHQARQRATAGQMDQPQQLQDGLSPQLWLHCRLQVSICS